jgi:hypothetical protein
MKRVSILLFLFILFSFNITAEDTENNIENIEQSKNEIKYYNISGFTLELSCFNYFNIGLGYNWGEYKVMYNHFFASDYGFYIEYKTKSELHIRLFYDLYGGSAGMLMGASGAVITDFEKITAGLAPHIGVGFPGMKMFYRYNFYINKELNCHEIVLIISNIYNKRKEDV